MARRRRRDGATAQRRRRRDDGATVPGRRRDSATMARRRGERRRRRGDADDGTAAGAWARARCSEECGDHDVGVDDATRAETTATTRRGTGAILTPILTSRLPDPHVDPHSDPHPVFRRTTPAQQAAHRAQGRGGEGEARRSFESTEPPDAEPKRDSPSPAVRQQSGPRHVRVGSDGEG